MESNRCTMTNAPPVSKTANKRNSSSSEDDDATPITSDDSMENATNAKNLIPLFRQEVRQHKELNVGHLNNAYANNEQVLYQQFLDCRLQEQREVLRQKEPEKE